jgi:hypothetical protein
MARRLAAMPIGDIHIAIKLNIFHLRDIFRARADTFATI